MTTAFDLPGFMAGANARSTGVGEVGGNEYAMYLGELPQTPAPSPYRNLAFATWDLPEAYKGKNEYMEDIVKGLVITERNDWIMSLFPVMETPQQHFKFTSYTLHRKLLSRVPNEGISRLLVSSKHQTFAHTVRRGIAMTLEGDFARTPEGQREYTNKMIGMAGCVVDTFKTESMFALMRAGANMRAQQAMYGNDNLPIEQILQREVDRFGILNCDTAGFAMVLEEELGSFQAEGKNPDTLVVPPGTVLFMRIMPTGYVLEKVVPMQQEVIGPNGALFTRGGAEPRHTFANGISMVEAPPVLREPGNAVRAQAFYTTPVTSEHYPMTWKPFANDRFFNGVTKTDGRRYESKIRDMYIFDAGDDMHRKITFAEALKNSRAFEDEPMRRALAEHEHDEVAFTGDDPALAAGRRPNATTSQRSTARSLRNGRRVPLLLYWNERRRGGRGGARARYFGQLDQVVAPTAITRQIADTLLAGCAGLSPQSLVHWEKGLELIKDLENATATLDYLKALSNDNRARSVPANPDRADEFVGETTAEGDPRLTDKDAWGHSNEREWKPNVRGSMDLPQWHASYVRGHRPDQPHALVAPARGQVHLFRVCRAPPVGAALPGLSREEEILQAVHRHDHHHGRGRGRGPGRCGQARAEALRSRCGALWRVASSGGVRRDPPADERRRGPRLWSAQRRRHHDHRRAHRHVHRQGAERRARNRPRHRCVPSGDHGSRRAPAVRGPYLRAGAVPELRPRARRHAVRLLHPADGQLHQGVRRARPHHAAHVPAHGQHLPRAAQVLERRGERVGGRHLLPDHRAVRVRGGEQQPREQAARARHRQGDQRSVHADHGRAHVPRHQRGAL
jgi:hypothetical protein